MRLIKVGVASVSPTVGAVQENLSRLLQLAREMARDDVTVACFPEQAVGGYPPEDLVQWQAFVAAQRHALAQFATDTNQFRTVFVVGAVIGVGGLLYNSAVVIHAGQILGSVPKEKLPTYGVFYERRTFSRGAAGLLVDAGGVPLGDRIFEFGFGSLAVEVCEDGWSPDGPMRRRCYSGAELVVNISASPYRVGIAETRREMFATRSADNQATLAYANLVGGQDALVFDGGGFVFQNGRPLLEAPRFREGYAACVLDLDRTRRLRTENTTWRSDCEAFQREHPPVPVIRSDAPTDDPARLAYPVPPGGSFFLPPDTPTPSRRNEVLDELFEALALGVKDYFAKTGAFKMMGVALSGGRDSLLTLLVAWRAIGLRHPGLDTASLRSAVGAALAAFYMPTRFSRPETRAAAECICSELGIPLRVVPVDEAFQRELEATRGMLDRGAEPTAVTQQNIQARIRGERMWNWANTAGALFLQTSDMSEKAVGYTTIGGDLEGGLSVIANVPKTVVVALLERLHTRFGFEGITRTLGTAPGPELAERQAAEDELMPFPMLDACLYLYAGEKLALSEIAGALPSLFPDVDRTRLQAYAERFVTLFSGSIYKWVQAPLALHVGALDLDRERALQLPVVQGHDWRGESR